MFTRRGLVAFTSARASLSRTLVVSSRGFSKFNSIESGGGKLTRALDKEIKYENDNYTQLEDIEQYLNESGFAFTEHEDSVKMSLKKTVGDKLVEIRFEAR
jgi:hypothetical protein